MKEEATLRSALSDILRGFSVFEIGTQKVYIKHLGLRDSVDFEEIYEKYYNMLQRKGVESEKEILEKFHKQNLWSEEKEIEIQKLKQELDVAQNTLDKIFIKEQAKEVKKYVEETKKKYALAFNIKWGFIKHSREVLTNKKVNEYYIIKSLYKDSEFKENFISEEQENDIDFDLNPLIAKYQKNIKKCDIEIIKKISIKSFFRDFWDLSDQNHAYHYFGKPISRLTYNQVALSSYAVMFGNIFKNYPEIKSDDPDKIIQLVKRRSELEKRQSESKTRGNQTYVNMSSEEYDAMGITRSGKEDLFEKAMKNGGKLRIR